MRTELEPKILIVDDDIRILELLKEFFERNSFICYTASDTTEAEKILSSQSFDLLILDVMLPRITGFEFASTIKSTLKKMPIILLTALSESDSKIKGLETGADDYVVKPFDPRELILRVKNLIELYKNTIKDTEHIVVFGSFIYNMITKECKYDNEIVNLSSTEQKLLELFLVNKNKVLTREDLSKLMGGLNDRSIDVQIVRLRQKIEPDIKQPKFLQTVRHEGYAFYA